MKKCWVFLYITSIVFVNYLFSVIPLVDFFGEKWPPTSLACGLVFVVRDFAQREIGHKVLFAMFLGGIISWFMASPYIAVASVVAFGISELVDWATYTFTGYDFSRRVLLSSTISTPIDSIVFLHMIGHLSVTAVVIMTVSKMVGAFVIFFVLKTKKQSEFA